MTVTFEIKLIEYCYLDVESHYQFREYFGPKDEKSRRYFNDTYASILINYYICINQKLAGRELAAYIMYAQAQSSDEKCLNSLFEDYQFFAKRTYIVRQSRLYLTTVICRTLST